MLCEANLTAKEFSNVHNALCDLRYLAQRMESVVHPDMHLALTKSIDEIRKAFDSSYKQEDDIATRRSNHYTDLQTLHGLSSIWAINSVDNLYDKHPTLILQLEQCAAATKNMLSAATGLTNDELNKALNQMTKGLFIRFVNHDIVPTERFRLGLTGLQRNTFIPRLGEVQ